MRMSNPKNYRRMYYNDDLKVNMTSVVDYVMVLYSFYIAKNDKHLGTKICNNLQYFDKISNSNVFLLKTKLFFFVIDELKMDINQFSDKLFISKVRNLVDEYKHIIMT